MPTFYILLSSYYYYRAHSDIALAPLTTPLSASPPSVLIAVGIGIGPYHHTLYAESYRGRPKYVGK